MEILRRSLAVLLGGFGALVTLANWAILASNLRNDRRRSGDSHFISFIPVIGGVSGALAVAAAPVSPAVRSWFWVPLIVDYTIPITVVALAVAPWRSGPSE